MSVVEKRADLMRYYAEKGYDLRNILPLIGVKWETALRYCRKHGIAFPDHKRKYRKEVASDED